MREAIVLAGGFGTRLQAVVRDLPKPMAPLNGIPFLSYLLDELVQGGFTHVVLSTGYRHEQIEGYYGESYRNVSISYARELEPLGTGGGILNALQQVRSERAFVLNGDTLFKVDFQALDDFHRQHHAQLSVVLRHVPDTDRYGSVETDSTQRIVRFVEKHAGRGAGFINGGIYLLEKSLFNGFRAGDAFSFEKELMEKKYETSLFYGMSASGYFIDIGIPEDYVRAQRELLPKSSTL
ncbi:MAG: nucleotidyltransferase family protein [Bacteroidales bacterium]|nr:nucleotidyltransferase family protein [Bacteroidales bacterium]